MDREVIISYRTIVLTLLTLVGIYVIYKLGPIFGILIISGLLVMALEPLVKWLRRHSLFGHPISRSFAVIVTYLLFIVAVLILVTSILPPVISQAQKLIISLSTLLMNVNFIPKEDLTLQNLLPQISKFSGGVIGAVSSGVSFFTTAVSLLMISVYMSLDWENLKRRFISLFPDRQKLEILRIAEAVESNVGNWVKGELLLMLAIGGMEFAGLIALRIRYPLALALLAGILEAVPILGPVITAVIASIIAFADSPIKGIAIIAFSALIHQLENNLLVPKIMQKVSGFSPLAILIALLIGNTFFGIIGAVVAVPLTMVLVIIVKSILRAGNQ